jgi:hypothetical protein
VGSISLLLLGLKNTSLIVGTFSFVLNNGGYTVERLIHGKTESYNDVALWDYSNMAKTFGPHFPSKYHGPIKTNEELVKFIQSGVVREDCFHVSSSSLIDILLEAMVLTLHRLLSSSFSHLMHRKLFFSLVQLSMNSISRRKLRSVLEQLFCREREAVLCSLATITHSLGIKL